MAAAGEAKTGSLALAPSGRQLFGISRDGLDDLGADLSADRIDDGDGISRLIITYACSARPFLPLGAIGIALDLPFPMHDGPARRLDEGRAILGPIDHALASLRARGGRGGLYIDGFAREKRFDFGTRHIGGEGRSDQATDTNSDDDGACNNTHVLAPLNEEAPTGDPA